jgi:enoyl-CoA hydratase/carnithine racemase
MSSFGNFKDLAVTLEDEHVAVVEIRRAPNNFFDVDLINAIADAYEALDDSTECRAIVLAAEGKNFCAGANFGSDGSSGAARSTGNSSGHLYQQAVRIFRTKTPVIAAVQGAAIGGGLGLAVSADFRVTCPEGRFSANFTRLGFHPGFGLTYTLPRLVGVNKAAEMFYTGRRVKGDEALEMGLADKLVPLVEVRSAAIELATEIARSAPLAGVATRATVRGDLADRVQAATDHELEEQNRLRQTNDGAEGVKAMAERRIPDFTGT